MRLIPFPPPPVTGAWSFTNDPDHKYLRPWFCNLIQLALLQAFQAFGAAPVPPAIADCSTVDGRTPEGHPGSAHDNGVNVDITYPMISWPGSYHVGAVRNNQLSGPPTYLFTGYTAAFFTYLAIQDRRHGGLFSNIAVDPRIEGPVESGIEGFGEVKAETRRRARDLINASRHVSWVRYHTDHVHLRGEEPDDPDRLADVFAAESAAVLRELRGEVAPPAPALTLESLALRVERLELAVGVPRGDGQ